MVCAGNTEDVQMLTQHTSNCYIQGSHVVLKVWGFKIRFQDLEKVLNLAKIYIKYCKSMEILNEKEIRSI